MVRFDIDWAYLVTRPEAISLSSREPRAGPVRPEPDTPDDPDNGTQDPDVHPGGNADNPGDQPEVTEPGKPAKVIAQC